MFRPEYDEAETVSNLKKRVAYASAWLARVLRPVLTVLNVVGLWLWKLWVGHKRRVIHHDWMELEFAPLELRAERQTVLAAVKQDWRALEFACDQLKADKEIVEDAVRQSWRALRFASRALRSDRDIMIGAVRQSNGWALEFAAEELYQDQELVTEATTRLGGPLGLPLTPITTFVPEEDVDEAGVRSYGLQAVPIHDPDSNEEDDESSETLRARSAGLSHTAATRREVRAVAAEARRRAMLDGSPASDTAAAVPPSVAVSQANTPQGSERFSDRCCWAGIMSLFWCCLERGEAAERNA